MKHGNNTDPNNNASNLQNLTGGGALSKLA